MVLYFWNPSKPVVAGSGQENSRIGGMFWNIGEKVLLYRRGLIRSWIIPLVLALVLVGITAYWGYDQYREKEQLQIYIEYLSAVFSRISGKDRRNGGFNGKKPCSTSPGKILFFDRYLSHANTAQAELNKLPL